MYEVSLGQCNLNVALDYHLSQGDYRALFDAVHSDSHASILRLEENFASADFQSWMSIKPECWTDSMDSLV